VSYARGRHSDSAAQNLVDGGTGKVSSYGALTANAFVAHDGNGNVIALIQENGGSGTILANYEYGPFGEVIRATGPMAKLNPFRFSTKYDDDETDFLYYGYRFYNPSTGRWLNRDPIEELGGINLYNFCGNAPSGKTDDFGLSGELVGCPACVCKKVKYGKVPTTFSAYHDNQGNGNTATASMWTMDQSREARNLQMVSNSPQTLHGTIQLQTYHAPAGPTLLDSNSHFHQDSDSA
jgi:RHS repeat-associated protein